MGIPLIFWQSFPLLARLLAPVLTPTTHSPPEPFLPLNKFEVLASTKVIYQNNFTRGATFFRIFGRRESETIKLFEIQNDSEVFVSPRKNNEYKLDLNISKFIIRLDCFFYNKVSAVSEVWGSILSSILFPFCVCQFCSCAVVHSAE